MSGNRISKTTYLSSLFVASLESSDRLPMLLPVPCLFPTLVVGGPVRDGRGTGRKGEHRVLQTAEIRDLATSARCP